MTTTENTNTERAGRFTKKPVTIDAWLIDFGNKPLPEWVNEAFRTEAIDWCPAGEGLYINTLEGHMLGANGSWLIKGVQGELYACKPDIFEATYTRASLSLPAAGQEPVADGRIYSTNGEYAVVQWLHQTSDKGGGDPKNSWSWPITGDAVYIAAPQPAVAAGWVEERENLRKALQFYADGDHFIKSEPNSWDTVSGEPQNYWCDEAGTATVEDGSIAKLALEGRPIHFEDDESALPPAPSTEGEKK
jgi:hypothetical protein